MGEQINIEASLDTLVRERDLIFVTGKGGVGKSTVTALLAELAVKHRGGAIAAECSAHPRLASMAGPARGVEVVNIDVEKALPGFLRRMARIPSIFNALLSNRVVRLFLRTAPAVSELILLDEISELVARPGSAGRPVIVDLPATGHAVTLLGTPRAARRLVRVGPVARLAERLEQLFLDRQRCELVVVALPEELPVNETIELVQRAVDVGFGCRTVVVNQVPEPPVEEDERGWLDRVRETGDSALGQVATTARDQLDSVDQARAQIERLREAVSGTIIELPRYVDPDPRRRITNLIQALAT